MGATLLPWWDDPAEVKPNEFERGVLTGMLIKCGKSYEPEPTKPEGAIGEWSVEYLFKGGAKIETWVTNEGIEDKGSYGKYYQIYINQRKTYSDGTVDKWRYKLSTYSDYGVGISYDWNFKFNNPNTYGIIDKGRFDYWQGGFSDYIYVYFKWLIPTTEPTVIYE